MSKYEQSPPQPDNQDVISRTFVGVIGSLAVLGGVEALGASGLAAGLVAGAAGGGLFFGLRPLRERIENRHKRP